MPLSDTKKEADTIQLQNSHEHNIVNVPAPKSYTVASFVPGKLSDTKGIKYSQVKKSFAENATKNTRFHVHELARGPLSIEREEAEKLNAEIERRLEIELAVIKEKIEKEAYEAGLSSGKKEAHEMILTEAKPTLKRFEKLVADFEKMKTEVFKANEEFFMKLIAQISKNVILKEVKEDKAYTSRLILNLIERVGTRENIKIYVSPEVFSAAEVIKTDLAQTLGQLKNISIELDPEVQDSGCRLETEFGEVDARLSVQLDNVLKAFDNKAV